jgi:hypothetical protein
MRCTKGTMSATSSRWTWSGAVLLLLGTLFPGPAKAADLLPILPESPAWEKWRRESGESPPDFDRLRQEFVPALCEMAGLAKP